MKGSRARGERKY